MAEKRWFKVTTKTGDVEGVAYIQAHKTGEFIPVLEPGESGKAGRVYTLPNGATLSYVKITRAEYMENTARLADDVLEAQAAIVASDGDQVDPFAEIDRELDAIEERVSEIERATGSADMSDLAGDIIDLPDGRSVTIDAGVSLGAPVNYLAMVADIKHGRRYGRRITFGVYRR